MSELKEHGGMAFPGRNHWDCQESGMTLIDYFAGQALMAMLTTPPGAKADKHTIALQAYHYGEAMLRVRKDFT